MDWVRLGDIVDIKTGKLNANAAVENGKYPFFTTAEQISRIDTYSYDDEVVLVAGNGDLNVKYYKGKFDAYQRTYILTLKKDQKYLTKYIYYFMSSYIKILRYQSIGGVIKYIKLENLTEAKIPAASIENQEKIIELFETLEKLIKIRQDQIQALDDLLDSSFDEISEKSDKKSISFDDIFTFIDGDRGKNYPKKNDLLSDGYCLFLNTKNVTTNGFKFDNLEFISQERDELLRKGRVERGDLILTTRGTVGNIAFYSDDVAFDKIRINSGMVILRRKEDINPLYFQHLIRKTHVLKSAMSGSAQPQLPIRNLKNVKILIIPIDQQNKFADLVTRVEGQKGILEDSLSELSDLFASLMQDAFDGSLGK